jgi:hypothetical protein
LWPSELVTIGLLFALKGSSFRSFYHWLERDYAEFFGGLPERTRLLRALRVQHRHTQRLLADPTLFTVIDTYGIELIHPWRYGRSPPQVSKKGFSNHRWIVGLKLCWLIDDLRGLERPGRLLAGLDPDPSGELVDGQSSFAWTLAHVTNQVGSWINVNFQRR